jgi:hypothetical protein
MLCSSKSFDKWEMETVNFEGGWQSVKLEFIIVAAWAWEDYLGLNVVIMQEGGARNEH